MIALLLSLAGLSLAFPHLQFQEIATLDQTKTQTTSISEVERRLTAMTTSITINDTVLYPLELRDSEPGCFGPKHLKISPGNVLSIEGSG